MTNSPKVNPQDLERVLYQLASALQEGRNQGPKADALWLALQRSGQFPDYKLTFYHRGRGEDTCGVVFGCHESN